VITTLSQGEPGDNVLARRGWAGSSGRQYNGCAGVLTPGTGSLVWHHRGA
jgi:hypothetical protein